MTENQKKQINVCRKNGLTISATAAATGLSVSAIKSYCSRRNNSEQPSDFHCKFCGAALMKTSPVRIITIPAGEEKTAVCPYSCKGVLLFHNRNIRDIVQR